MNSIYITRTFEAIQLGGNDLLALKQHLGVILSPTNKGFDMGASTWGCLFKEPDDKDLLLYYTGASDIDWTRSEIGVAISQDGINFLKYSGNPLLSAGSNSITPAVFMAEGKYWMVFSHRPKDGRYKLGIAVSDDPLGPWEFAKELIMSEKWWEGRDIDLGPSVVNIEGNRHLAFYSNISSQLIMSVLAGERYWHRQIGILELEVDAGGVKARRWNHNPLSHLNGTRGSWNESLFCPGYFALGSRHYLLPAASTYSVSPYRQYLGLIEGNSLYFDNPNNTKEILLNGHDEKGAIVQGITGEIALDTPSPLIRGDELWLYYAVMDRTDRIWKTALSIYSLPSVNT
jgi:hypothetical protein